MKILLPCRKSNFVCSVFLGENQKWIFVWLFPHGTLSIQCGKRPFLDSVGHDLCSLPSSLDHKLCKMPAELFDESAAEYHIKNPLSYNESTTFEVIKPLIV